VFRRLTPRRDLAEEPQGPYLVAPFVESSGELERLPGEVHGFILTASHQIDLTSQAMYCRFATAARLEGVHSIACSSNVRASAIRPDSA
jgi:hypothetical protein